MSAANDYIDSLSSVEMKLYAQNYWKWLQDGKPFPEPEAPSTLLASECHSVRVALADVNPDAVDGYNTRQYDLTQESVVRFSEWLTEAVSKETNEANFKKIAAKHGFRLVSEKRDVPPRFTGDTPQDVLVFQKDVPRKSTVEVWLKANGYRFWIFRYTQDNGIYAPYGNGDTSQGLDKVLTRMKEQGRFDLKEDVGQFVIAVSVSGGATGHRQSIMKDNGKVIYYDSEDEAEQEAKRLNSKRGMGPTMYRYWVQPA
jgi:hypothetical protein